MAARKIKVTPQEQREARDYLREYFAPGAEVPVVLTYVSSSGMSRRFKVLAASKRSSDGYNGRWRKGDPYVTNVTHLVAKVVGWKYTDNGEIVVAGAGMDMAFHLADTIGRALYGKHVEHELTRGQRARVKAARESRGNFFRAADL
jgi:hypothetical protein